MFNYCSREFYFILDGENIILQIQLFKKIKNYLKTKKCFLSYGKDSVQNITKRICNPNLKKTGQKIQAIRVQVHTKIT